MRSRHMAFADEGEHAAQRFFIGIGVGVYEDATLNLPRAEPDVVDVAEWFTKRSGIAHEHVLAELGKSPRTAQITESLADFLEDCTASDVVVIYIACHGELEGARTHLFGRNTRREKLAGRSIDAATLGTILGQSAPHNLLLIIDACVAGRPRLASRVTNPCGNPDSSRGRMLVQSATPPGCSPSSGI